MYYPHASQYDSQGPDAHTSKYDSQGSNAEGSRLETWWLRQNPGIAIYEAMEISFYIRSTRFLIGVFHQPHIRPRS